MAYTHFIPKIEWLTGTLTGTTSIGSPIVTGIASTALVEVGAEYDMFFEGTGVPAGAVVLSKTANSVTLDKNATAAGTNTFSFGHRLEFEYPPKKNPLGEDLSWVGSAAVSKSGLVQYIEDYTEIQTDLEFSLISQAIKDKFEWFLLDWCFAGNEFTWFADKNEPTSAVTVTKGTRYTSPDFKVITRKGAGFNFVWSFKLSMRRVY